MGFQLTPCHISGLSRVCTNGRRADHEELPVPRVDSLRPNDPKVQLVVLRRLQVLEEPLRQQHTDQQELPAHEGARLLLRLQEPRQLDAARQQRRGGILSGPVCTLFVFVCFLFYRWRKWTKSIRQH